MDAVHSYVSLVFSLTTLLTVWVFYKASNNSATTLIILITWLALQAAVGLSGFYTTTDAIPPRFFLLPIPPLLAILFLFVTKKGKRYVDGLDAKMLTILHTIRIPVELVLFWLFLDGAVPQLMTFEGRNFDIISGVTAPLVFYFGYLIRSLDKRIILLWNFLGLALLINIVGNAVLSAPFPFQRFAFDQPNIAVLYFPYVWLPACVVPLVLLSHLATIRQLIKG